MTEINYSCVRCTKAFVTPATASNPSGVVVYYDKKGEGPLCSDCFNKNIGEEG